MNALSYGSIPGSPLIFESWPETYEVAEMYGGDVRYADSTLQAAGGHALHVEGGAEILWRQVGHLTMALREMCDQVDRLRAYECRKCGEPAAIHHGANDPSPFLKYVISQETT